MRMFTGTWMLCSPFSSSVAALPAMNIRARRYTVTVALRLFAARRRPEASILKWSTRQGRFSLSLPFICRAALSIKPEEPGLCSTRAKAFSNSSLSGISPSARPSPVSPASRPRSRRYSPARAFKNTMPPVPSVRTWKNSTLMRFFQYSTRNAGEPLWETFRGRQGISFSSDTLKRRFAVSR